jgi:hypothetical protein
MGKKSNSMCQSCVVHTSREHLMGYSIPGWDLNSTPSECKWDARHYVRRRVQQFVIFLCCNGCNTVWLWTESWVGKRSWPILSNKLYIRLEVELSRIMSVYGLDDRAIEVQSPERRRIFPLASVSRPALGPTQPPVQWVPGILSPGIKHGRGVNLTTHPHLVPRSRMSKSYTSSPSKRLHGV